VLTFFRSIITSIFLIFLLVTCGGGDPDAQKNDDFSIGGEVTGLNASLILLNIDDELTLTADGLFTFSKRLSKDQTYSVSIKQQPEGQICLITNMQGIVANSDITDIEITCQNIDTDTTAPTITISSPNTTASASYTLVGDATDDLALANLTYSLNGADLIDISTTNAHFSVDLTLIDGDNLILLTATDVAGNIKSVEFSVSFQVAGSSGTSLQQIDSALSSGKIDQETAVIYKVFSAFDDSRLPVEFRGVEGAPADERDAFEEAWLYILDNTISDETKNILQPFFVPPYYEGSWWDIQSKNAVSGKPGMQKVATRAEDCKPWLESCAKTSAWSSIEGTNFVVWYLTKFEDADKTRAQNLLKVLDQDVWPKLTTLMRLPIPDDGFFSEDDPRYDVIITDHLPARVEGRTVVNAMVSCSNVSTHSFLNRNLPERGLSAQGAHEFMHGIQYAYKVCPPYYKTISESTATWATEYTLHDNNWEHNYLWSFIGDIDKPLDWKEKDLFPYGAYLFMYYLYKSEGEQYISTLWDWLVIARKELPAIERALNATNNKSLDQYWPGFAVQAWNRYPIINFQLWDNITPQPAPDDPTPLATGGKIDGFLNFTNDKLNVAHLSTDYRHFKFTDSDFRSLAFFNGFAFEQSKEKRIAKMGDQIILKQPDNETKSGRHVMALVKVNDLWKESAIDLTQAPFVHFCRDTTEGRINEIVLMFINSQYDENHPNFQSITNIKNSTAIWFSNIGCNQWKGNANFTLKDEGITETLSVSNLEFSNSFNLFGPSAGGGAGTPGQIMTPGQELVVPFGYNYNISKGTATWNISGKEGSDPVCTHSGSTSMDLSGPLPALITSNWASEGNAKRGAQMVSLFVNKIMQANAVPVNTTCVYSDGAVEHDTYLRKIGIDIEFDMSDSKVKISESGISLSGNHLQTPDPAKTTGTWTLNAVKQ